MCACGGAQAKAAPPAWSDLLPLLGAWVGFGLFTIVCGALAALHAEWRHPGTFGGLLLQSGSFFVPDLDGQESGHGGWGRITAFVAEVLRAEGYIADVRTTLAPAWSTDWISERGRQRLTDAGIAPPGEIVSCPRCGSQLARLVSEFSGTACKAIYTCQACREPFELFKAI